MSHTEFPENEKGLRTAVLPATYPPFDRWYPTCEMNHKRFWLDNVKSNWTVLDVGANVGIFTILFSKLCAQVYAFEPIPETVLKLRENLHANACPDNVQIVPLAVSNWTGARESPIHPVWGHEVRTEEFLFTTLDDWIKTHGDLHVDAVKIDVDSYDYEVLLGAEQFLRAQRPIVVAELNHALALRGFTVDEPKSFMTKLGFTAIQLDDENYAFIPSTL